MIDVRFALPGRGAAARAVAGFATGWLFGGRYRPGTESAGYDDRDFATITIPHTVTPLGWLDWDPQSWDGEWIYRRHVQLSQPSAGERLFLGFDGVLVGAAVWVNDVELPRHLGGYQPFGHEIGDLLHPGDNVVAVVVDGGWHDVPPDGAPGGPAAVDYCQPAGIYRAVHLRSVPTVHIADVFARPVDVLGPGRRVDVEVTVDAAEDCDGTVRVELRDGGRVVSAGSTAYAASTGERSTVALSLGDCADVELWDVDSPKLYDVVATIDGPTPHEYCTRIGFREARFTTSGLLLNGHRHQVIGVNRHQLYPFVGMAMPARVQRRDAEIIRRRLGATMVRCAHYPQAPEFLDACDELGLMVWEEPPGWQYLPDDAAYHRLIERDVAEMVLRDRNHPSIITWGVRVNESRNEPELYARTRRIAYELDGSRATTGSMVHHSTDDWAQDLFGFDDYTGDGVDAGLKPPLDGVPYLLAEAVGALSAEPRYRRIDTHRVLARQALAHAQVHDVAHSDERYSGLLGWVCFDYASQHGRIWRNLKTPGLCDTFRIPKYGASTYATQVDPARVGPLVMPLFDWVRLCAEDAGERVGLVIATNCDLLEFSVAGTVVVTARPDRDAFAHLPHPPITVDLSAAPAGELHIDGFLGGSKLVSRLMSAEASADHIELVADDDEIRGDGIDMSRIVFRAVDGHGNWRSDVTGTVRLDVDGQAEVVGANPFDWSESPGAAAVWLRAHPGATGEVRVTATHGDLGAASVTVALQSAPQ